MLSIFISLFQKNSLSFFSFFHYLHRSLPPALHPCFLHCFLHSFIPYNSFYYIRSCQYLDGWIVVQAFITFRSTKRRNGPSVIHCRKVRSQILTFLHLLIFLVISFIELFFILCFFQVILNFMLSVFHLKLQSKQVHLGPLFIIHFSFANKLLTMCCFVMDFFYFSILYWSNHR